MKTALDMNIEVLLKEYNGREIVCWGGGMIQIDF